MTDSPKNSPSKGKKVRGIPFTSETGKAYQKSSSTARMARCKLRADLLLENRVRVREIFNEAIETLDADKLEFATKALTFLGVDFRASPEFVQKLDVEEKTKTDITINYLCKNGN